MLYLKAIKPIDSSKVNTLLMMFKAALLSSGASVISIASDIAGSIRLPAAFTGVFGHKPTPGNPDLKKYIFTIHYSLIKNKYILFDIYVRATNIIIA